MGAGLIFVILYKRTADEIAEQLEIRFKELGWIKKE